MMRIKSFKTQFEGFIKKVIDSQRIKMQKWEEEVVKINKVKK
jgi:hypothetical protein